jgi:drug/metabolite transporter (DMT)-like permease
MSTISFADSGDPLWIKLMPWIFVLIWSTGFIVARYGMPYAPPMKFLVIRYGLSLICFVVWVGWARVAWPQGRHQWLHLSVTGVLMHAFYLGGVWAAVKAGMGSGVSALIVGLQPVLTAIWLSGLGKQITRRQWAGLCLGLLGLVLVVSRKFATTNPGDQVTTPNLMMALTALAAITAGTLYQKHYVTPCDVRSANAVQLGAALLVTLPFAALETEVIQWNSELFGAMAWSVLGLTVGGSSLLYMLIQRGAATTVTSLMYLVPPCTAVLAWLLFSEPLTGTTLLGMSITALGVALVVRPARMRPR